MSSSTPQAGFWPRISVFAVLITAAYLYVFPYFPNIHSANELPRVYLTEAMADQHTFAIDAGVAKWGATADVSPHGGHQYSNKAPGSSMLAVPGYLVMRALTHVFAGRDPSLGEVHWVCRFTTGVVPTLLFLWLLWGFLARFTPEPKIRRAVILAYALGSMAMTYSILFISHQLATICIASGWILVVRVAEDDPANPQLAPKWMWIAGLLAGAAPLVDYQAAFAGVPIAIWVVAKIWRRDDRWALLARAAIGAIPPILLLLYYHKVCFGSPFKTGYDASETFAHFHQQGFLGLTAFRMEAFIGSTVSPDNGLITFAPWLLLALRGILWMWRAGKSLRAHAGVIAATLVIYIAFISSINFWRGGWQLGPRYITVLLPFLLPAVAVALQRIDRRWILRGIAWGTILVGIIVYAWSAAIFPHFPEKFVDPMRDLVLHLTRDGLVGYNAAFLVGVHGIASLLPYLAILVAAIVTGFSLVPRSSDDDPRGRSFTVSLITAALLLSLLLILPARGPQADEAYRWVTTTMPSVGK